MDNLHKSEHVFQNDAKSLVISFINGIDQGGTVLTVKCQETMVISCSLVTWSYHQISCIFALSYTEFK